MRNRTKIFVLLFNTLFCYSTPISFNIVLDTAFRQEIKRTKLEEKEIKLSLFTDDMILHIENPKDSTRKLLQLICEFGKVAKYKINTRKSVAFLFTNNERSEREIKKQFHLPSHQK